MKQYYDPEHILVQFKEPVYQALKGSGGLERKFLKHRLQDVPRGHKHGNFRKLKTSEHVEDVVQRLRSDPDVEWAVLNMRFERVGIFTDNPIHIYDVAKKNNRIGGYLPWAHDIVPVVDPDLEVAIHDSGVIDHPDLNVVARIRNTTWTSNTPSEAHGTLAAGATGAINNTIGSYGSAPGVKIVDTMNANAIGQMNTEDLVSAWAPLIERPNTKVVSNSWAAVVPLGKEAVWYSNIIPIKNILNDMFAAGIIVVFAAGNDGTFADRPSLSFPHAIDGRIITVGGTSFSSVNMAPFTTFSGTVAGYTYDSRIENPDFVDVSTNAIKVMTTLPWYILTGKDIYTGTYMMTPGVISDRSDLYGNASGTSFACPTVSGVVALMLTINPTLTASQTKQILRGSGDVLRVAGSGKRLNVLRALLDTVKTLPNWQASANKIFYAKSWAEAVPLSGSFSLMPRDNSDITHGGTTRFIGNTIVFYYGITGPSYNISQTTNADGSLSWYGTTFFTDTSNIGLVVKYLGVYAEYLPAGTLEFDCPDVQSNYHINSIAIFSLSGAVSHIPFGSGHNAIQIPADTSSWHFCTTVGEGDTEFEGWWITLDNITFASADQTPKTVAICDVMTLEAVQSVSLEVGGVVWGTKTEAPYDFIVPTSAVDTAAPKQFLVTTDAQTYAVEYGGTVEINLPPPATPAGGRYQTGQTVTLNLSGTIIYTLDGSDPRRYIPVDELTGKAAFNENTGLLVLTDEPYAPE